MEYGMQLRDVIGVKLIHLHIIDIETVLISFFI